jgi:hypothetical protein
MESVKEIKNLSQAQLTGFMSRKISLTRNEATTTTTHIQNFLWSAARGERDNKPLAFSYRQRKRKARAAAHN